MIRDRWGRVVRKIFDARARQVGFFVEGQCCQTYHAVFLDQLSKAFSDIPFRRSKALHDERGVAHLNGRAFRPRLAGGSYSNGSCCRGWQPYVDPLTGREFDKEVFADAAVLDAMD